MTNEIPELCDSRFICDVFETEKANTIFNSLMHSTEWDIVQHRGGNIPRLISIQAEPESNMDMPVYRHPTDYFTNAKPFSETVV